MDKPTLGIFAVLFLLLMIFVWAAAVSDDKPRRVNYGIGATIIAALAFFFTGTVISFNYNAWYSSAADRLMAASVKAMEEGREADVLREWKAMDKKFRWQYETKGDFRKIAEEAIEGMSGNAK